MWLVPSPPGRIDPEIHDLLKLFLGHRLARYRRSPASLSPLDLFEDSPFLLRFAHVFPVRVGEPPDRHPLKGAQPRRGPQ